MKKLNNVENIENYKKRETLRILSIIFAILTMLFAAINFIHQDKWWLLLLALLSAVISTVLLKARETIPINKLDGDVDDAKIKKIKEKKKVKKKNNNKLIEDKNGRKSKWKYYKGTKIK